VIQTQKSLTGLLVQLLTHLTPRRRLQLFFLLLLAVFASLAEALSIGTVMPFLGVLTNPQTVFDNKLTQPWLRILQIDSASQLAMPITLGFAFAAIVGGVTRLLLVWATTRWTFAAGADISTNIYHRTLYQPYSVHISRNSSEIISSISTKVDSVIFKILQLLNMVSATVILFGIIAVLLLAEPLVSTVAMAGFGMIYGSVVLAVRKRLNRNSECIAQESSKVVQSIQEGLGGIRDILLDGSQEIYCRQYSRAGIALRRAHGDNVFLSSSPRYAVEALSMLFIAFLAYQITRGGGNLETAIPILGLLALGAQRMLPAMQTAYSAWASMRGELDSFRETIALLEQRLPAIENPINRNLLPFSKLIELKNLSFGYEKKKLILREINLKIEKGSRVGIVGVTGSGKSSLLDILMGLLSATEGRIEIDGELLTAENQRQWQARIAHVPQVIFLADASIEENIAFGVEKKLINRARVKFASQQAQIDDVIEGWPTGYKTFVGERGIRLSGGQRQRIGIARALYKQADILIFDEATSALDMKTEEAVMAAITSLPKGLTILTIAHRLTTLRNCSQIIELDCGKISRILSYEEYLSKEGLQNLSVEESVISKPVDERGHLCK
jgi:ATP-binding cassette subfamily B protein